MPRFSGASDGPSRNQSGWPNDPPISRPRLELVVEPGNAGLAFFQQFVGCVDPAVEIAFVGGDSLALHAGSGYAHVNGRDFIKPLSFVATVFDALRPSGCPKGRLV